MYHDACLDMIPLLSHLLNKINCITESTQDTILDNKMTNFETVISILTMMGKKLSFPREYEIYNYMAT